ncbi:MAG: SDR family NAD(P)-dependent oxidoreductase, partial [Rhodospirillales bacterium]
MDVRMDGRNAIITGGSAGLGKAMAMEFMRSGANVAIVARRQDVLDQAKAEIAAEGKGTVIAISADIRQADECTRTFNEVVAALGQVDILVNNAGTSRRGPFLDISDAEWQDDFDLKVFSAIRFSKLVIPGMRERKWGRIINVL